MLGEQEKETLCTALLQLSSVTNANIHKHFLSVPDWLPLSDDNGVNLHHIKIPSSISLNILNAF